MSKNALPMSEKTAVLAILGIVVVIAVVGLLLSLGAVKTGNGVHEGNNTLLQFPTAPVCPEGAAKALTHSELHVALRHANMNCQASVYPQYVCCFAP